MKKNKLFISQLSFCYIINIVCSIYIAFFFIQLIPQLLDPWLTTDDAMQQTFIFNSAIEPNSFSDDLISEMMKHYFSPLHYSIQMIITKCLGNAVMSGHMIMLIQLLISIISIFYAVKWGTFNKSTPAIFAVSWFLHHKDGIEKMAGGLPRGWWCPIIALYIAFSIKKNHNCILILIFFGCLTQPTATLTIALAYGLFLLLEVLTTSFQESTCIKNLINYMLLSPIFIAITLSSVNVPEYLGSMISYNDAIKMPEFSALGRFPILPFDGIWIDILNNLKSLFSSSSPLLNCYSRLSFFMETFKLFVIVISFMGFSLFILSRFYQSNKTILQHPLFTLFLSMFILHQLSQLLAFQLYIPNRYVSGVLPITLIIAFSTSIWNSFSNLKLKIQTSQNFLRVITQPCLGIFYLLLVIIIGSGLKLQSIASLNTNGEKDKEFYNWLKEHTKPTTLIAGHPYAVDPIPLFGIRKTFITYETAQPFYTQYYKEVKRRLIITLEAHYEKDICSLSTKLKNENIDYFVFKNNLFEPNHLSSPPFFAPYNLMLEEFLLERNKNDYAFFKIIQEKNNEDIKNIIVFSSPSLTVIDVNLAKQITCL